MTLINQVKDNPKSKSLQNKPRSVFNHIMNNTHKIKKNSSKSLIRKNKGYKSEVIFSGFNKNDLEFYVYLEPLLAKCS